ncbi:MAG: Spy/CpxP family protein refolding chaperone [Armatimonadota bacterium]|nr:Spy/CpxP family protein refolding chaperone [Armatimonadota bacterium]
MRFLNHLLVFLLILLMGLSTASAFAEGNAPQSIPPAFGAQSAPRYIGPRMTPMPFQSACPAQFISVPVRLLDMPAGNDFLKLSGEQKTKIKALTDSYEKEMVKANESIRSATKSLMDGLMAKDATMEKAQQLAAEAGKAETAALQVKIKYVVDLKQLLTAEQCEKVFQMMGKRMGPMPMTNFPPTPKPNPGAPPAFPPAPKPD